MGTLSNLRGAVFDLITGINGIENLPGIRLLKQTLNGIANTIAGTTPTGERLQAIVSSIVNDVGMLVGGSGLADFDGTLNSVLDSGREFLPIAREILSVFTGSAIAEARNQFGSLGGTIREVLRSGDTLTYAAIAGRDMVTLFAAGTQIAMRFARALGYVAVGSAQVARWSSFARDSSIDSLFDNAFAPASVTDRVRAAFGDRAAVTRVAMAEIGQMAGRGLRQGLLSELPGLNADVAAMASSIPKTSASTLGVKSPSRVMADEIGRHIPTGIAEGIDRGRGSLDRAMQDLVPMPGVPGFGPGSFTGLGGAQFHFHFTAPEGADEDRARSMARMAFDEFANLLEPIALAG